MPRPRVRGMRQSDVYILEHLYADGNRLIDRPIDIAANIGFAESTVGERVLTLRDAGLIEYYDESKGLYVISDLGARYLEDELTDDEIDELESLLG